MPEQPPISKTPTREEVSRIGLKAHSYLLDCIHASEPAQKLSQQISLGIMTKLLKMYHNLLRVADSGDTETPSVLARQIFEYALSLSYMIVNEDDEPDIYEKFRQSAFLRVHKTIKAMKKSPAANRSSTLDSIISLENMLKAEGYDFNKKIVLPKSWHPTESYMTMAYSLGDHFKYFYDSFYEVASIFVHPNWLDIKRQLNFNNDKAHSRLINEGYSIHPVATATCTVLEFCKLYRIKLAKLELNPDEHVAIIKKIDNTHYSLHN